VAIDLNKIRARLEDEKKRLQSELEGLQTQIEPAEVRREGSPFGKREEEATESFELEKRLALRKQAQNNLNEIEHALEKFKAGTYGLCDICGQPISSERLDAMPHANLCLACKAKYAKNRLPTS
jgi:DnaK suppressor protein